MSNPVKTTNVSAAGGGGGASAPPAATVSASQVAYEVVSDDLEQPLLQATNVVPVYYDVEETPAAASATAVASGSAEQQEQQYDVSATTTQQYDRVVISFGDRRGFCSWLCNLIWFVFAGWHLFLAWVTIGCTLCVTIIGIPFGWQCIKIGWFVLFPFGKKVVYYNRQPRRQSGGGRGGSGGCCYCCGFSCCSCSWTCILNLIWIVSIGWILALQALLTGIVLCLTLVGIPFGIQCFKLMYICFKPFGMDFIAEEIHQSTITTTTTTTSTTTAAVGGQRRGRGIETTTTTTRIVSS